MAAVKAVRYSALRSHLIFDSPLNRHFQRFIRHSRYSFQIWRTKIARNTELANEFGIRHFDAADTRLDPPRHMISYSRHYFTLPTLDSTFPTLNSTSWALIVDSPSTNREKRRATAASRVVKKTKRLKYAMYYARYFQIYLTLQRSSDIRHRDFLFQFFSTQYNVLDT